MKTIFLDIFLSKAVLLEKRTFSCSFGVDVNTALVICLEWIILWRDALLEPNVVLPDKIIPEKISTFTFLQKLVSSLDKIEGPFTEEQLINNLVDKIEDLGKSDRKTKC